MTMTVEELKKDAYKHDSSGRHPVVSALQDAMDKAARHEMFLTMHLIHAAIKKVGFEIAAHAEGKRYTPYGDWPESEDE